MGPGLEKHLHHSNEEATRFLVRQETRSREEKPPKWKLRRRMGRPGGGRTGRAWAGSWAPRTPTRPPARGLGGGRTRPAWREAGRQTRTAGRVSCRARQRCWGPRHPAPRRTCGGKARLLPAAGRDPSQAQEVRGRRWGAPRGAPLTPGPVPRSSFDCSGDRRRPLGAAGRTRVLASRVDSNLGSSACHLREHKHLIVLLGHRSFHVYNGITMNDS